MERLPPILSSRLKHAFSLACGHPQIQASMMTTSEEAGLRQRAAPRKRACRSAKNRDHEPNPYSPHAQAHAAEFAPLSEPYRTHDRFG